MKVFKVKNKIGRDRYICCKTPKRAIEICLSIGYVRKIENGIAIKWDTQILFDMMDTEVAKKSLHEILTGSKEGMIGLKIQVASHHLSFDKNKNVITGEPFNPTFWNLTKMKVKS